MKKIYSVKDLYKKFGNNVLLNSISFSVRQGEVIGLVGHNGVGKTTLMKCILGLSKMDGGGFISDSNNRVNYENVGALIGRRTVASAAAPDRQDKSRIPRHRCWSGNGENRYRVPCRQASMPASAEGTTSATC